MAKAKAKAKKWRYVGGPYDGQTAGVYHSIKHGELFAHPWDDNEEYIKYRHFYQAEIVTTKAIKFVYRGSEVNYRNPIFDLVFKELLDDKVK